MFLPSGRRAPRHIGRDCQLQFLDRLQPDIDVRARAAEILAKHQRVVGGFCSSARGVRPHYESRIAREHDAAEHRLRYHDIDDGLHERLRSDLDKLGKHRMDLSLGSGVQLRHDGRVRKALRKRCSVRLAALIDEHSRQIRVGGLHVPDPVQPAMPGSDVRVRSRNEVNQDVSAGTGFGKRECIVEKGFEVGSSFRLFKRAPPGDVAGVVWKHIRKQAPAYFRVRSVSGDEQVALDDPTVRKRRRDAVSRLRRNRKLRTGMVAVIRKHSTQSLVDCFPRCELLGHVLEDAVAAVRIKVFPTAA